MKNLSILLILTSLLGTTLLAQCYPDDSHHLTWHEDEAQNYAGAYHFGDSEGESTLKIFVHNQRVWAQIIQGSWSEDGTQWLWNYTNIDDITIGGNSISSSKFSGKFTMIDRDSKMVKGLLISSSWSGLCEDSELEFGYFHGEGSLEVPGRFPEASLRPLSQKDLEGLSPDFMRYMRNEIFARYGYRFKTEIGSWFKQQSWYVELHDDVTACLTQVEKENIALLKSLEE